MPSRRSHTKSHHGCQQCKARRVKCDETTPQCERCSRRGMTCSFMENAPPREDMNVSNSSQLSDPSPSSTSRYAFHSQSSSNIPTPASLVDTAPSPMSPPSSTVAHQQTTKPASSLEFELIHYYSTQTYMTMTSKLIAHVVWRDTIFHEALKHDFLLHALMATAALHKAVKNSASPDIYTEYTKVAYHFHNLALAGYIQALGRPTKDNAAALFALSALLSIWIFATKKLPAALNGVNLAGSPNFIARKLPTPNDDAPADFIEILTLIQGINTVCQQTIHWLVDGELNVILRPPMESDLPANPPDIEYSFVMLEVRINDIVAQQGPDAPNRVRHDLYRERLTSLRRVSRARTVLEWDSYVFSWPVLADRAYIELLRTKDPVALALFAHWAACFKCLDHLWWATGWSYRLVRDASAVMDPSWNEIMRWPRKEVGLTFQESAG